MFVNTLIFFYKLVVTFDLSLLLKTDDWITNSHGFEFCE